MQDFLDSLPPLEDALKLEPEELAPYLLIYLARLDEREHRGMFTADNFFVGLRLDQSNQIPLRRALIEAWAWLEREGLLARDLDRQAFVTRRGKQAKSKEDVDAMRLASLLPRKMLHPKVATKAWPSFLHGDYETAVFCAFKQVEVAVRDSAGLGVTDIGVKLMRDAFHPDTGPLADRSIPAGERQGLSDLFAGAMGYHRNPVGHRTVPITDPADAVHMITLASHLLNLVDESVKRRSAGQMPAASP